MFKFLPIDILEVSLRYILKSSFERSEYVLKNIKILF